HYKSYGTFFLHSKSPITSAVALPTTDIIEPYRYEKNNPRGCCFNTYMVLKGQVVNFSAI
ncbi:hypothetical protein, partial [Streptococcus hyointestinalis]